MQTSYPEASIEDEDCPNPGDNVMCIQCLGIIICNCKCRRVARWCKCESPKPSDQSGQISKGSFMAPFVHDNYDRGGFGMSSQTIPPLQPPGTKLMPTGIEIHDEPKAKTGSKFVEASSAVYNSWPRAMQLDYCIRRDLAAAEIAMSGEIPGLGKEWFLERAAGYKDELAELFKKGKVTT